MRYENLFDYFLKCDAMCYFVRTEKKILSNMSRSKDSLENSFQADSLLNDFAGPSPLSIPVEPMKGSDLYTIQAPTINTRKRADSQNKCKISLNWQAAHLLSEQPGLAQTRGTIPRRSNKIRNSIMSIINSERKPFSKTNENGTPELSSDGRVQVLMRLNQEEQQVDPLDESKVVPEKKLKGFNLFKVVMAKSYFNNFVDNLLQRSYVKKPFHFSSYQNKLMDDLTYQTDKQTEVHKPCAEGVFKGMNFKKISQDFYRMIKKIGLTKVFEPNGKLFITWEIFHIFTILVIFFWIPFKLSFNIEEGSNVIGTNFSTSSLEIIFLSVIGADIILTVNMAYIEKGVIIRMRRMILMNYIKGQALVDLSSLTILMTTFLLIKREQTSGWQILPSLVYYFIRTQKIKSIIKEVENYFHLSDFHQDLFGLAKLVFSIILIGHLFACLWHGVAYYNIGKQRTWLDQKNITDADNLTRYLYSFYWASMTMTTVGYGDVTPQNNLELVIANLTMFLACGVFAFSINTIGVMFYNLNSRQIAYQKNVNTLNKFMTKNSVNPDLQMRIRSYFDYQWQEEIEMNDEEIQNVIQKLSAHLQEEIKYELRVSIMRQSQALAKFSDKVLKQLSMTMEEVRFSPDQLIFMQNCPDDSSLYLITKGAVQILFNESNESSEQNTSARCLKKLKVGDSFGEYAFFTGLARSASAYSDGFSKVFKIKRVDMLSIVSQSGQDRELFCSIKDNLGMFSNFYQINMSCYSCHKANHMINKCPALHYVPDKERVLKKYLYPINQNREKLKRKLNKYHHFSTLIEAHYMSTQINELWKSTMNDYDDPVSHLNYDDDGEADCDLEDDGYQERSYNPSVTQNTGRSKSQVSRVSRKYSQHDGENLNPIEESQESRNSLDDLVLPMAPNMVVRKTQMKLTHMTQQTAGFGDVENSSSRYNRPSERLDSFKRSSEKKISLTLIIPHRKQTFMRQPEDVVEHSQKSQLSQIQQPRNSGNTAPVLPKTNSEMPQQMPSNVSVSVDHTYNNNRNRTQTKHRSLKTLKTARTARGENTYTAQINTAVNDMIQEEIENFDRMALYKTYFPLNNYDYLIKRVNRFQKMIKRKNQMELSVYTFSFFVKQKAAKMKKAPGNLLDDNASRAADKQSVKAKIKKNLGSKSSASNNRFTSLLSNPLFKNSKNTIAKQNEDFL